MSKQIATDQLPENFRSVDRIEQQIISSIQVLLKTELQCGDRRRLVADLFAEFGAKAVRIAATEVVAELQSDTPRDEICLPLLYLLGLPGPAVKTIVPEIVGILNCCLTSQNTGTILAASFALYQLGGDPSSVTLLRPLLVKSNDPKKSERVTRRFSLKTIARIGSAAIEAIPELILAISDVNKQIRQEAVRALARIGAPAKTAVPYLVKALNDVSDAVKFETICALLSIAPNDDAINKAIIRNSSLTQQSFEAPLGAFALMKHAPKALDLLRDSQFSRELRIASSSMRMEGITNENRRVLLQQTRKRLAEEDSQTVLEAVELMWQLSPLPTSRIQIICEAFLKDTERQKPDIQRELLLKLGSELEQPTEDSDQFMATELLIYALSDTRWDDKDNGSLVRVAALSTFEKINRIRVRDIQKLIEVLTCEIREGHVFVRRSATFALSRFLINNEKVLGQPLRAAIVETLIQCLDLESERLENTRILTGRASGTVIRTCCRALEMLPALAKPALEALERIVNSNRDDVVGPAKAALTAIATAGKFRAVDKMSRPELASGTMPNPDSIIQLDGRNDSKDGSTLLELELKRIRQTLESLSKTAREVRELSRRVEGMEKKLVWATDALFLLQPKGIEPPPKVESSVALQIAEIRRCCALTLREIGERIGVSESQMSRIARGHCQPSKSAEILLARLAEEVAK
jgi:HEAT repeat protein